MFMSFYSKFIQETVYQILTESPEFCLRYYQKHFGLFFPDTLKNHPTTPLVVLFWYRFFSVVNKEATHVMLPVKEPRETERNSVNSLLAICSNAGY